MMETIEVGSCSECGHFPTQFIEGESKALKHPAISPQALELIDSLALSLADHGHQWTPEQRAAYEQVTEAQKALGELQ